MNKRIFLIVVSSFLLAGCATQYVDASVYEPYGFFSGVLHGFLLPFELIAIVLSWILSIFNISLFTDVTLIGKPNTGLSYGIGYFFGLIGAAGFGEQTY